MNNPKYFIGPMTKNVVDSIIEFCNATGNTLGLIPSRRQVDWNGGYVGSWTTSGLATYVKTRTDKVILQRDHSGPGQGQEDDFGYRSLLDDSKHLDLIHIDPWKKHPGYAEGLMWTVDMIKYCSDIFPGVEFEVGTEEAIRRFESEELDRLLADLRKQLKDELFFRIKYLVIQSGTSLKGTNQTGQYDSQRLADMIAVAKKHNLLTKEHNGDYIPVRVIHEKFNLGLDAINIAPEFGLIETQTYIDQMVTSNFVDIESLDMFWEICYNSKKWTKWVDKDFDPYKNRIELIKICGHYVISSPEFVAIKKQYPYIDKEIKSRINQKLRELYGS